MAEVDQILNARWVLPIEPNHTVLEHHSVVINNDEIVAVLPTHQAKEQFTAKTTFELSDHVVMPGLVNAHNHLAMNLLKGIADDLPLNVWLQDYIWPAEAAVMNDDTIALGSELAMAECIKGGTTCFNDFYFFPEATAKVAERVGMRGLIGLMVMEAPVWLGSEKACLIFVENRLKQPWDYQYTQTTIAPHAPYTVSDDGFRAVAKLAEDYDQLIHLHLHETRWEIDESIRVHGKRPVARLDELGIMTERLIAVHNVHLLPQEIALFNQRKVKAVHCPESNLKLASGTKPLTALQADGVTLGLGTDGTVSNNDLSMLGEMRSAAFLAKTLEEEPTALSANEAIKMATLGSAQAMNMHQSIGSLLPGKKADVIAIDLNQINTQPTYNPMSSLAYCAEASQVTHSWIDGRCVMNNRELLSIDEKAVINQARQMQAEITAKVKLK